MRENMERLWQWLRDRKTNTVRRWRSSFLRVGGSMDRVANGVPHSYSAMSLPSNENRPRPPEYDKFFEEPQLKEVLEVRRRSFRDPRPEQQPVPPPDVECPIPNPYIERLTPTATPRGTPQGERRSPRQIRFHLPEVRVSFEEERVHQVLIPRSYSPLPPAEVEWTPVLPQGTNENEQFRVQQILSMANTNSPTTRRNSASERARQNLLAQRRQSNVQLAQSMTGRRASTTLIPLTSAQIHLVRSLWRQIYTSKGPTVIGTSIYHRLCFKCPLVKEQIRRVELPSNFRDHDTFIKAHSKALAELIDQVVENLDNLDNMTEELVRIGRVHARILHGELTGKLWNVVAETFIDCTLEWGDKRCRSETVRKAWALIVAFVVEKIKLGHHEQRKVMLATRQSFSGVEGQLSVLRMS